MAAFIGAWFYGMAFFLEETYPPTSPGNRVRVGGMFLSAIIIFCLPTTVLLLLRLKDRQRACIGEYGITVFREGPDHRFFSWSDVQHWRSSRSFLCGGQPTCCLTFSDGTILRIGGLRGLFAPSGTEQRECVRQTTARLEKQTP